MPGTGVGGGGWAIGALVDRPGMDQLSQRDQMQVMAALNEMQMQEWTRKFSTHEMSRGCFPTRAGDDEHLQQLGGKMFQRVHHELSNQGIRNFRAHPWEQ